MKKLQTAALILLTLAGLFFCFLGSGALSRMQSSLIGFLAPISQSGHTVKSSIGSIGKDLLTLDQLETEYSRLYAENRRLRAENNGLRDLLEENNHLRQVLGYREHSSFLLVPATILSHDAGVWWNTVKVNRGTKDGISTDMPVITDRGLIGKTTTVSDNISEVLLITDENCKVAAKVEGTKEQGICAGPRIGNGDLQLTFLSKLADLQPGQKVYTAGVSGGVFPSGIALGTVKSFHPRELDGEATLEPTADLDNLEEVFIVTGGK
jgi:rod shape-determining protein MreC